MIWNLSLNGNSPEWDQPDTNRPHSRLPPLPARPSVPARPGFCVSENPEASTLEGSGAEGAPGWRQPHGTLETDATLLVTLGELDTEELGSSKTWFVHNNRGNNNNHHHRLLQPRVSVQPQQRTFASCSWCDLWGEGHGERGETRQGLQVTNFHERSLVSHWFNWQGKRRCWEHNGDAVRGGKPRSCSAAELGCNVPAWQLLKSYKFQLLSIKTASASGTTLAVPGS